MADCISDLVKTILLRFDLKTLVDVFFGIIRKPLPKRVTCLVSKAGIDDTMQFERRFPPPWTVEEQAACFVVRDHNGQQLAYVYFEDEPGRRSAAKLSCAALAVPKRLQLDPQVSGLSVTQLDGYRY